MARLRLIIEMYLGSDGKGEVPGFEEVEFLGFEVVGFDQELEHAIFEGSIGEGLIDGDGDGGQSATVGTAWFLLGKRGEGVTSSAWWMHGSQKT